MAGFRLKMATQLGEKVASENGFKNFPVKPIEIAKAKGINVVAKSAEVSGVSGALIFAGGSATLIYSTEYQNSGFENFCVGHELGHWFLPGHPDEILKQGGTHLSRADFTQNSSIELEADHFAGGLLMPSGLTRAFLGRSQVGLEGILALATAAECSRTAAAIRAAESSDYPLAIIVSRDADVAYAFQSESFKGLGKLSFLRKGSPLPDTVTRRFNVDPANVFSARRDCGQSFLGDWFDGPKGPRLDEEVVGLGRYGFTLTVLSSEEIPRESDEEPDEDAELERSWTPRFAYNR